MAASTEAAEQYDHIIHEYQMLEATNTEALAIKRTAWFSLLISSVHEFNSSDSARRHIPLEYDQHKQENTTC